MLDSLGIERALGSSFLVACDMSNENRNWFNVVETQVGFYITQLFHYRPDSELKAAMHAAHATALSVLRAKTTGIRSDDFHKGCSYVPFLRL